MRLHIPSFLASALALASLAPSAAANGTPVRVTVTGTVEYNQITAPPLGNVSADDPVTLTILLSSSDFVNSPSFPTRGYVIAPSAFSLKLGATTIGLQSPFPAGQTPYFVLRNNDPGVDGFFVATSVDFPSGVPLAQTGVFGQFNHDYSVTYTQTTLPSLDILDALGTYDYTGLQVFNWTVDDGPFNPLGITFTNMVIEALLPGPTIYCQGKVNTQGCTPSLSTDPGLPSLSGAPWHVTATNLLNNKTGIFFFGFGQVNLPFQGGTLCVKPPVIRTVGQNSGGNPPPDDCSGVMVLDLTTTIPASLVPNFINLEAWARDPADPFGSSLSNAVEVFVRL